MAITTAQVAVGTGSSVSVASVLTDGEFSLTFNRPVLYKRSADGVFLIVPNGAAITGYTPAEATVDGASVQGFCVNVAQGFTTAGQGHDARVTASYSVGKRTALPYAPQPHDSVILQKALPLKVVANQLRAGVSEAYCGFQFVASLSAVPPDRTLAGPLGYWVGKTAAEYEVDIPAFVASLPTYSLTPGTYPSVASVLAALDKYHGLATVNPIDNSGASGYEVFFPQGSADLVGNTNQSNYGQYLGRNIGALALHLLGDVATTEQKRKIATRLAQIGCQVFEGSRGINSYADGAFLGGLGGHAQWEFIPLIVYLSLRGLTADLDALHTTYGGNVLLQPFIYTQAQVDQLAAPHTDPAKANASRQRTVTAVTGNKVSISTFYSAGDVARLAPVGLRLIRVSDSDEAIITAVTDSLTSPGFIEVTVDAQPSPAFQVGDTVWMRAQHTIAAGDADWKIGPQDAAIMPNALSEYRAQNFHMPYCLVALAIPGAWRAAWAPLKAYCERSMLANNPGAGTLDYAEQAENVGGLPMVKAFYDAHKASLGIL